MPLLGNSTLQAIISAAIDAGLDEPDVRILLFARMKTWRGRMPRGADNQLQLRLDLATLNDTEIRVDGSYPLAIWLENARPLMAGRPELALFESALQTLQAPIAAEPEISAPVVLAASNEAVLFQDDMLSVAYLRIGLEAGRSVARLQTPRYDGAIKSATVAYWGTGWLIAKDLLITNHHVFNARDKGEAPASAADLTAQALGTIVEFDFNSEGGMSTPGTIRELVTSDSALDFAIVRIDPMTDRQPLALMRTPLKIAAKDTVPLNIIQHPEGKPKKIAIRNNLATPSVGSDLRYFTATLPGSSGSPVFTDDWKVAALHRGSSATKVLNFLGRQTAIINYGTQIPFILDKLSGIPGLLEKVTT